VPLFSTVLIFSVTVKIIWSFSWFEL